MGAGDIAQMIRFLPSIQEALDSIPIASLCTGKWHMPKIPALGRERQEDQKFKVIFGYTVNSRARLG